MQMFTEEDINQAIAESLNVLARWVNEPETSAERNALDKIGTPVALGINMVANYLQYYFNQDDEFTKQAFNALDQVLHTGNVHNTEGQVLVSTVKDAD